MVQDGEEWVASSFLAFPHDPLGCFYCRFCLTISLAVVGAAGEVGDVIFRTKVLKDF